MLNQIVKEKNETNNVDLKDTKIIAKPSQPQQ